MTVALVTGATVQELVKQSQIVWLLMDFMSLVLRPLRRSLGDFGSSRQRW